MRQGRDQSILITPRTTCVASRFASTRQLVAGGNLAAVGGILPSLLCHPQFPSGKCPLCYGWIFSYTLKLTVGLNASRGGARLHTNYILKKMSDGIAVYEVCPMRQYIVCHDLGNSSSSQNCSTMQCLYINKIIWCFIIRQIFMHFVYEIVVYKSLYFQQHWLFHIFPNFGGRGNKSEYIFN